MKLINFQRHVQQWMLQCFGTEVSEDRKTRSLAFMEEAIELVQAEGLAKEDVLKLADYVYGRPVGETRQEAGGVLICVAGICNINNIAMHEICEDELTRCIANTSKIREKQKMKFAAGIRHLLPPDSIQR